MKSNTTPRTLADSQFVTGYSSADLSPRRPMESIASVVLATVIGIALAALLLHWSMQ